MQLLTFPAGFWSKELFRSWLSPLKVELVQGVLIGFTKLKLRGSKIGFQPKWIACVLRLVWMVFEFDVDVWNWCFSCKTLLQGFFTLKKRLSWYLYTFTKDDISGRIKFETNRGYLARKCTSLVSRIQPRCWFQSFLNFPPTLRKRSNLTCAYFAKWLETTNKQLFIRSGKLNIPMENGPWMKMYFLLKTGIFQRSLC